MANLKVLYLEDLDRTNSTSIPIKDGKKSKLHSRYFQELRQSRDLNSCKPQQAHQCTTQKSLRDFFCCCQFAFFCFFLFSRRVETYYPQLSYSSEQCLLRLTKLLMEFSQSARKKTTTRFSLRCSISWTGRPGTSPFTSRSQQLQKGNNNSSYHHHSGIRVRLTLMQRLVTNVQPIKSWSHRGIRKLFTGRDLIFLLCLLLSNQQRAPEPRHNLPRLSLKDLHCQPSWDLAHQENAQQLWFSQQGTGIQRLFLRTGLMYIAASNFDLFAQ